MQIFNKIDIYLYAFFLLLFILNNIKKVRSRSNLSVKLFTYIIVSTMLMLFLEGLTWVVDGLELQIFRYMNYIFNWLLLALNMLPVVSWIAYIDFKIFGDEKSLRTRLKFYFIPVYISFFLLIMNFFNSFVFYLTPDNYYTRGPGLYVLAVVAYTTIAIVFILSRRYKKYIEGRLMQVIILFSFLPLVGTVIQLLFYGASLSWPICALTVVIAYILVEREQMLLDTLTGLMPRGLFENRLSFKLKKNRPFTLIMTDMDEFKLINDTYGHEEGDNALITAANILSNCVKREDLVCRYAGDEFMLIVESINEEVGIEVSNRIQSELDWFNNKKVKEYTLSMSFGVVYVDTPCTKNLISLLAEVDTRMYKNKFLKKNSK